jgi:cell division septal protein FtsQ
MRASLWQLGIGVLLLSLLVSFALVFSSPERLIQASVKGDYFVSETTSRLALESKFYLLEPNLRLQSRIEALGYISNYSIERSLPNRIRIEYTTKAPLACSNNTVHYSMSQFDLSDELIPLCQNTVYIEGTNPTVLLSALEILDDGIRNLIERIEYQEDQALVTLKNGQQALVYPSDLTVLQTIITFSPQPEVLDLRRNYA